MKSKGHLNNIFLTELLLTKMLEELNSNTKLEARGRPVPPPSPHWDTVVQLQPSDPSQLESHAQPVAQSEVLRHSVKVVPHVAGEPIVADVPRRDEDVGLEEVSQAALARPEGERSVEVESTGPVERPAQRVAVLAGSDTADVKAPHTERTSCGQDVSSVYEAG